MKSDYTVLGYLGKGSYARVNLVKYDGIHYALKELDKDFVISHNKSQASSENEIFS